MCGIVGLIGESKNPEATYQLLTRLFEKTEKRGEDSSGFWGTQKGKKGGICYHKEPQKSTDFVDNKFWKGMRKFNSNLLLMHARAATPGIGTPDKNKNNHPFVSDDVTLSIIHNGKLPEYHFLKEKYETFSDCDSELVLRILQCENEVPTSLVGQDNLSEGQKNRLAGIKQLWSLSYHAHMAIGVGEWFDDGTRQLWLWRNSHRPLWIADMRDTLGQIFFFSEDSIWWDAVRESPLIDKYLNKGQKMYEMPDDEIWFFEVDSKNPVVTQDNFHKFNIIKESISEVEEDEIDDGVIQEDTKGEPHRLICGLDEQDEPLDKPEKKKIGYTGNEKQTTSQSTAKAHNDRVLAQGRGTASGWRDKETEKKPKSVRNAEDVDGSQIVSPYHGAVGIADVEEICEEIKNCCELILADTTAKGLEECMSEGDYKELVDMLEISLNDLRGTRHTMFSTAAF